MSAYSIISTIVAVIAILVSIWLFYKGKREEKKASLEHENKELKAENEELKKQIELRDMTYIYKGLTIYTEKDGSQFPVCPVCTSKNPAFPLPLSSTSSEGTWICPVCDKYYKELGEERLQEKLIDKLKRENSNIRV